MAGPVQLADEGTRQADRLLGVDEQVGLHAARRSRQGLMTGPVQCDEAQRLVQLDQSL